MNDDKCGGNIGLFNYQPLPSSYLLPSQIYIELHRPMSGGCWWLLPRIWVRYTTHVTSSTELGNITLKSPSQCYVSTLIS